MAKGVRIAPIVRRRNNPMKHGTPALKAHAACPVFQLIGRICRLLNVSFQQP